MKVMNLSNTVTGTGNVYQNEKWIPKPRFMPGIRVALIWRIEALILHLQTVNINFRITEEQISPPEEDFRM